MAGLYKDFDEIEANCPDSIYGAVKYMREEYDYLDPAPDMGDDRLALELYVSTVAYMEFGSLYDKATMLELQREDRGPSSGDDLLTRELPREYDRQSEALCLSSALHLIHQKFPNVHEQAIDCLSYLKSDLAREKGIDIDKMEREVYFEVPEHLTGKSAFPEYLDQLIEEKLDGIRDDLYIEKSITWAYSHLDQGLDYDYSKSEYPYVTIKALNSQSLDIAEKRLENITDKEILERKELVEKERVEAREKQIQDRITEYSKDKPEPYFENKYCSCYKEPEIPKDLSPYTLNPDKNGFTPIFTISTPETNIIYVNDREVSYSLREELIPGSKYYQSVGDKISDKYYPDDKCYRYSYEEIKDDKEFKDRVDKCMDKLIERYYDREHETGKEHEKDIKIQR